MSNYIKLLVLSIMVLSLGGCPLSMEPGYNDLLLINKSELKLGIFFNLTYPDSSLKHSIYNQYLNPNDKAYIGTSYNLKEHGEGLTVTIFEHGYLESKWGDGIGRPDTYLEEDKILKRFVLSRSQLDSTNWTLTYP